jgi:hypothetical protein
MSDPILAPRSASVLPELSKNLYPVPSMTIPLFSFVLPDLTEEGENPRAGLSLLTSVMKANRVLSVSYSYSAVFPVMLHSTWMTTLISITHYEIVRLTILPRHFFPVPCLYPHEEPSFFCNSVEVKSFM